jgi:hypothetical protein
MENRLVDQIEREMGFFLPLSRICKHNVRENEWTGGDLKPHDKSTHRNCVPLHERLQENLEEDRGIGGLCDDLESVCWILRAWRLDLSMIRSVEARVRGEGFEGVPAGDRRVWHRGPGWDGFGSAPAEW